MPADSPNDLASPPDSLRHSILRHIRYTLARPSNHFLPRELLKGGTSEILNWVALDGAVGPLKMTLIDYIPGYRSRPSTGCAMAFAYWD